MSAPSPHPCIRGRSQLQLARARRTLSQEDVIWSERRQELSGALSAHRDTPHAIGDDVALDVTSYSGAKLAGLDAPVGLVLSPDRDAERRMMEEHLPHAAAASETRGEAGEQAAASELSTVPEGGGEEEEAKAEGEPEEGEREESAGAEDGAGEQPTGSEALGRKRSSVGAAAAALDGAGDSESDSAGPQRRAEAQMQRMTEPGTGPLDKRGYLYVLESSFLKTWRRRWIQVHSGKLLQFKSAKVRPNTLPTPSWLRRMGLGRWCDRCAFVAGPLVIAATRPARAGHGAAALVRAAAEPRAARAVRGHAQLL